MKPFKSVLFTLSVATLVGTMIATPVRPAQASDQGGISTKIKYRPDLIVSDVEPVYAGGNAWTRGILVKDQVWVKVTNQGPGAAGSFGCFFEWDYGYGNEVGYFWYLPGLAPGQSTWFLADAHGYDLWRADHRFRFQVNYDQGLIETDYSNDTYDRP